MDTIVARSMIVRLPDAPAIEGLVVRPFDPDRDFPGLVALIGAAHRSDRVDWLPTIESYRNDLVNWTGLDLRRDILLAEADGRIVAATETEVAVRDSIAVHDVGGWVEPWFRRRGLGRALLHWAERRAREVAATDTTGQPHQLSAWIDETQAGAIALLESEGYEIVRYGFMMLRDLADEIPAAPLPVGLEVRPVRSEDHRRIWDADVEAFRDHWATRDRTEEDYIAWYGEPELDTALWRVAWEGDEVAGSVMTFIFADENRQLGVDRAWLEHISVRRPWRGRGLATALIADTLRSLREAGVAEAALGVDAENVMGALRVYESLGFRRHQRSRSYRKAM